MGTTVVIGSHSIRSRRSFRSSSVGEMQQLELISSGSCLSEFRCLPMFLNSVHSHASSKSIILLIRDRLIKACSGDSSAPFMHQESISRESLSHPSDRTCRFCGASLEYIFAD